ncbi:type ISP restriction/modification enzyme [Telluribacter sp. SYSU D00476]|uniref:type ISP restriction/modification enzyme n=1 Tax=Telluribacter sp. SYSU D00476 TaxID=2811430 RepID=UPI001FF437A6|nr:type ISP restriction/modification enzyme [Telluribacter sp. SYSU D00476]
MSLDLYLQSTIRKIIDDPELLDSTVQRVSEKLGISYISEKEPEGNVCFINSDEVRPEFRLSFSSTDLYDYLYAVLLSLPYPTQANEIDQTDVSRIPMPKDSSSFWRLVQLGKQLRQLHRLEDPVVNASITLHSPDGNYVVYNIRHEWDRIYINDTTYFERVPEPVWHLYLGGYQPAQQWLHERLGHTLTGEDILQYQRIITALTHSLPLIAEIDRMVVE